MRQTKADKTREKWGYKQVTTYLRPYHTIHSLLLLECDVMHKVLTNVWSRILCLVAYKNPVLYYVQ